MYTKYASRLCIIEGLRGGEKALGVKDLNDMTVALIDLLNSRRVKTKEYYLGNYFPNDFTKFKSEFKMLDLIVNNYVTLYWGLIG